jgi:hypothetical protein
MLVLVLVLVLFYICEEEATRGAPTKIWLS